MAQLSAVQLSTLHYNQIEHFEEIKKRYNIDLGYDPTQVLEIVTDVFTDSPLTKLSYFSAIKDLDDNIPILERHKNSTENDIAEMAIVMKRYTPNIKKIPLISLQQYQKALQTGYLKRDILIQAVQIGIYTQWLSLIKESVNPQDTHYFNVIDPERGQLIRAITSATSLMDETKTKIIKIINDSYSTVRRASEILRLLNQLEYQRYEVGSNSSITDIIGASDAINYLRLLPFLKNETSNPRNLLHFKAGELSHSNLNIYVDRNMPSATLIGLHHTPDFPVDSSIVCVVHTPIYYDADSETFNMLGDISVINPDYLYSIKLRGLDKL